MQPAISKMPSQLQVQRAMQAVATAGAMAGGALVIDSASMMAYSYMSHYPYMHMHTIKD